MVPDVGWVVRPDFWADLWLELRSGLQGAHAKLLDCPSALVRVRLAARTLMIQNFLTRISF